MRSAAPSRSLLVDADARDLIRFALDDTLAVEAAAGTGKTTVLVDRIVNVLASGRTTVDRIVAATSTEKAAGELKLRLRAGLERQRQQPDLPAHTRRALDHALANLEQAHVSTIHGFCADLLRERPVEAHVDPQFQTLTEAQAEQVYAEVFRDWLEARLEDPPEGVRRALRRQSFYDEEHGPIARLRRAGWTLAEWRDFPTRWRLDPFDRLGAINRLARELDAFVQLTNNPGDKRDSLWLDLEPARRLHEDVTLKERLRARDHDRLESGFVSLCSWRFKNPRTGRQTQPYRSGVPRADVLAAHQQFVASLVDFVRAADADLAARLHDELRDTVDRYQHAKTRLGALDFLDLLVRARDLVRDRDDVRQAFQRRFTHIFVDEFQDTDPLQAELLLLLSADAPLEREWRRVSPEPGKLFIVGDPKQSIYRFRRADVGVYQQVREQLVRHGARAIELTTSFRAAPTIQRAINAAFAPVMTGDADTLQADYVPLSPVRTDPEGQPSVVALPVPEPFGAWGRVTNTAIEQSQPDAVGAFVDWLVNKSGWTIADRDRPDVRLPILARHVCLLFRRFESFGTDVTRAYVDALEARGLPHLLVGGKSFHDREEVEMMRTALTALEWPDDELSVYGTLRGALFGIRDEELLEYRHHSGRVHPLRRTPVDAAVHAVEADGTPRFADVVRALDTLRELHVRRNYRPVAETISRLLDETRAHVALVLRPAGEQALANVQFIVELARQYEAGGGFSFRGFVERLKDEAATARSAEAPMLEEGSDGVRLMSAHRAKGLEFPIVILADMTAKLSHGSASRFIDADAGRCAVKLAGWAPYELLDHEAEELAREEAEGIRVAYVAATRARDLLVIPALGDGPQDGWISPLNRAIYPPEDQRRTPEAAPGCPPFAKDSAWTRPGGTTPFTNVAPGRHWFGREAALPGSSGSLAPPHEPYAVVWWDPQTLELKKERPFGIRREELIAKDAPAAVVSEGLRVFHEWRVAREGALERGGTPSARVVTVRSRAAADVDGASLDTVRVIELNAGQRQPRGARFGALVHAALGLLAYDAAHDVITRGVEQQARVLGASTEEQEAAVDLIDRAFRHAFFDRVRAAAARGRVRRETPLTLLDDHGAIVEGVVDLAFEEDDRWLVVDFKTDYELEAGTLALYRRQVQLYADAIARVLDQPAEGLLVRV